MRFYKKIGRLTEDEQAVIQQIEKLATAKGVPLDELATCHNFDDLLNLLSGLSEEFTKTGEKTETSPLSESNEPIFNEAENPENSHPDGMVGEEEHQEPEQAEPLRTEQDEQAEPMYSMEDLAAEQEPIGGIDEDKEAERSKDTSEQVVDENDTSWLSEDYDPFSEEIIQRSYNGQQAEPEDVSSQTVGSIESEPPLSESGSTPVDNLNPNTKRKAAEQTANALLKGYAKLAPKPFKWLAKIDEEKIEKLSFDGQIDISIEVSEGMTFDDYMKQTNAQVDEIFEVERETLDEIREPLVEVLMEQELELTPQQRLAMAVFSHLMQMLTVALKLRKQNNRILAYQKRITGMSKVQVA